jgi:hypothetical protein
MPNRVGSLHNNTPDLTNEIGRPDIMDVMGHVLTDLLGS